MALWYSSSGRLSECDGAHGLVYELPVGLSFISTAYDEEKFVGLAHAYEQLTMVRKAPKYIYHQF